MKKINTIAPPIDTYPIYSGPLSVMLMNEQSRDWLYNNFIQLCSNSKAMQFYDFCYKLCPYLRIQKFDKELIFNMGYNLVDFIKMGIDLGNTCYLLVNIKEIPAYNFNQDFVHDSMIVGYDDEEKKFFINDNFDDGPYSMRTCKYNELVESVNGLPSEKQNRLGFMGCIEWIAPNYMETEKGFLLQRVKDSLSDYINGVATKQWNTMDFRDDYEKDTFLFGIDCYEFVHEDIDRLHSNTIGIQSFHIQFDHKRHMLRLAEYLHEHGYMKNMEFMPKLKELVDLTYNSRNIAVKYLLSFNDSLLSKLHNKYKIIKEKDIEVMNCFLDAIR